MSTTPAARDSAHTAQTAEVGLWIFLGSTTVLFGAMMFSYAMLRVQVGAWPPPGSPPLPLAAGLGSTMVLALSSLFLAVGQRRLRRGIGAGPQLLGAMAAGWLFLVLQWRIWLALVDVGASLSSTVLKSVMLLLTGVHALHVLGGLFALALVIPGAVTRAHSALRRSRLGLVATFWHFVDVAWIVLFVCLFVI